MKDLELQGRVIKHCTIRGVKSIDEMMIKPFARKTGVQVKRAGTIDVVEMKQHMNRSLISDAYRQVR